jgi:hypothetical protein
MRLSGVIQVSEINDLGGILKNEKGEDRLGSKNDILNSMRTHIRMVHVYPRKPQNFILLLSFHISEQSLHHFLVLGDVVSFVYIKYTPGL